MGEKGLQNEDLYKVCPLLNSSRSVLPLEVNQLPRGNHIADHEAPTGKEIFYEPIIIITITIL